MAVINNTISFAVSAIYLSLVFPTDAYFNKSHAMAFCLSVIVIHFAWRVQPKIRHAVSVSY
jgi:hypothetical protein